MCASVFKHAVPRCSFETLPSLVPETFPIALSHTIPFFSPSREFPAVPRRNPQVTFRDTPSPSTHQVHLRKNKCAPIKRGIL
jgi:hypothetical protein